MSNKKPQSWSKALLNLAFVIPSLLNIARHFVSCVEYEAHAAKKSLISLVILSMIAITLMAGTWFCVCAMTFLWLSNWLLNPIAAFAIILVMHLILLLIISLVMLRVKDNMLFTCTRNLFH